MSTIKTANIQNPSAGSAAITIDTSSRVGIGTSPSTLLHLASTDPVIRLQDTDTNGFGQITVDNGGSVYIQADEANTQASSSIRLNVDGSERARIDSSGRLLVGTSTARTNLYSVAAPYTPPIQFEGNTNTWGNGVSILNYSASGYGGTLALGLSLSNTRGTNTLVGNGETCGRFQFLANDGTNFYPIAEIQGITDGTTSAGDVPGRLVFSTTADGASSPTERMRIQSDGAILAGSGGDGTWHGSVFSRLTGNVNRGFVIVNTGGGIGPLPSEANGTTTDNNTIFGYSSARWSVIYAATGTINTSDINEKQDVQDLSAAELAVAQELKTLLKTFRWKEAVQQKGDDARIHVGVMAQDVEAAFQKHGLDASRYALWCKDTWYEVEGKTTTNDGSFYTAESEGAVEKTRLGIRYDQLLAFVLAAL